MRFITAATGLLLSCALAVQAAPFVSEDTALAARGANVVIIDAASGGKGKGNGGANVDIITILNGVGGQGNNNGKNKSKNNSKNNKNNNNNNTTVVIIVVQAAVNVGPQGAPQGNAYLLTSSKVQNPGQAATSTSWVVNSQTSFVSAAAATDCAAAGTGAAVAATGTAAANPTAV